MDFCAACPVPAPVAAAMAPFVSLLWANPASKHAAGDLPKTALNDARRSVAALVGAAGDPEEEIVFTSCCTEANNVAVRGVVEADLHAALDAKRAGAGAAVDTDDGAVVHAVTTNAEHHSVVGLVQQLAKDHRGRVAVTVVPVDKTGSVCPDAVAAAVRADTAVVSVSLVNNELGTVNDLAAVVKAVKAVNARTLVHTDAAQALGKLLVDVEDLGVDMMSMASQKMYGPKGCGALYIRTGTRALKPLMVGAPHERHRRPGTQNVLSCVGMGAAAEFVRRECLPALKHTHALGERLEKCLRRRCAEVGLPGVRRNGHPTKRVTTTLSFTLPAPVQATPLMMSLRDSVGFSTGCAAKSGDVKHVSPILRAAGLTDAEAQRTIRLSLGHGLTEEMVEAACARIADAAAAQTMLPYK